MESKKTSSGGFSEWGWGRDDFSKKTVKREFCSIFERAVKKEDF
jgi:hypothetical protein